jgi:aminoglycoside phosphotransferase family enzyme/predicted kinase
VTTEDQTAVIEFLASPVAHGGAQVERIDTHSAIVFLAGLRAWKLKRAVRFDYLDFSTANIRKTMSEAEVRLNQRTAPAIYRGVAPVTRAPDGSLAINGRGTPVDWLVEMNRFDQHLLLDRMAERGHLDVALMTPLASAVARFHRAAQHRADHGGSAGMQWVIKGNTAGFAEFGANLFDPSAHRRVTDGATAELNRRAGLLDARQGAGFVRQCHGDLHLRNIVLLDGQPTLFDAVEFNDEIACIDVMYDLAFLLMDLWRRRLPRHANALLNGCLGESGDWESLALLPLFLSCRAAVRAKTSATAASLQRDSSAVRESQQSAREYLALADRLLHDGEPCVIAIGGFSGSGKSTVALGLAPFVGRAPGAAVLRTDEIRKRLCGVAPLERLGAEGYRATVSKEVYATAARHASSVVRAGHSVIVDAVFADAAERAAIKRVADDASVPFAGIWLDAPAAVLSGRTQRRERDASDATVDVVRNQLAKGAGTVEWQRLDASVLPGTVMENTVVSLAREQIRTRPSE